MRSFAIIGLGFCSFAYGANSSFEVYDFNRCQRWSITDDAGDDSPSYRAAVRLEKSQPDALSKRKEYSTVEFQEFSRVFSASTFRDKEQKVFVQKFGVCTYKTSETTTEFSCLPGQDFPFSGATYQKMKKRSSLIWMKCSSGCTNDKPPMIVDTAINEGESKESRELEKLYKDFQRRCKKDW